MTKPLSFRIVSVSDKPNSFGLHGYVLVSRTGKAYEVARSVGQWNTPWIKGMDIDVPMDQNGNPNWPQLSVEIPHALPDAPRPVLREIFGN
jgi:hypothetical protein